MDRLTLDDMPQEAIDLAHMAVGLANESFRSVSVQIEREVSIHDGSPKIVISALVMGEVSEVSEQYRTFQRLWRDRSPSLYRDTILLTYDIQKD